MKYGRSCFLTLFSLFRYKQATRKYQSCELQTANCSSFPQYTIRVCCMRYMFIVHDIIKFFRGSTSWPASSSKYIIRIFANAWNLILTKMLCYSFYRFCSFFSATPYYRYLKVHIYVSFTSSILSSVKYRHWKRIYLGLLAALTTPSGERQCSWNACK